MKETPGKIFLADQRILTQTKQFRRFSTFNFDGYYQEHKEPFGNLYTFNEESLAGSQFLNFTVEQASYIIILPIAGALHCIDSSGNISEVDVEEILVIEVPDNTSYKIVNPYENDVISLLQIWIKAKEPVNSVSTHLFEFNFNSIQNKLRKIVSEKRENATGNEFNFFLSLGQFAGRQEEIYSLKEKESLCFAFVLSGAFEVEGRLLHENDGLALWETESFELEALSNNALVLVLEFDNTNPASISSTLSNIDY